MVLFGETVLKHAIITGITGQDGSYLAELLLEKGYIVHGIKRKSSSFNTNRIEHLYKDKHDNSGQLRLYYGDLTDGSSLIRLIQEIQPDEIYNLAAQSHVKVSFNSPEYTANTNALGTIRLLEAIRLLGMCDKVKFYQASTSELFGRNNEIMQNEQSPFKPCSPYACAKLHAYWSTVNYREAYGIFAVNGILFNHESPRRGATFVTKKITRTAARIKLGLEDKLYLGNLDCKRDWGHSKDYVKAMWLMMQADKPSDYVIATGKTTSVRDFCIKAFKRAGMDIEFTGEGINEKGIDKATGRVIVEIDPDYYRPNEVKYLCGDASKARKELGWAPEYDIDMLIDEMYEYDYELAKQQKLVKNSQFDYCSVE
jgi:GDPmannose 4,6-dehydratase